MQCPECGSTRVDARNPVIHCLACGNPFTATGRILTGPLAPSATEYQDMWPRVKIPARPFIIEYDLSGLERRLLAQLRAGN